MKYYKRNTVKNHDRLPFIQEVIYDVCGKIYKVTLYPEYICLFSASTEEFFNFPPTFILELVE